MNNYTKTAILFGGLLALLGFIGYLIGGANGAFFFLVIGVIINLAGYWFSDRIALQFAQAEPLLESTAPELYADTAALASRMGIPMPRLYISPQLPPNAFATGKGPKTGVICVTRGLLQSLPRDEMRGVIAHELAHIKNRDVLTATIAAIIAGMIASLAEIGIWTNNDDDNRNPFVGILILIFAPIAATLVQLAISRAREFAADATAADFTQEPQSLANALVRIENIAQDIPLDVNPALASLYFGNPLGNSNFARLFSTHPPVAARVEALLGRSAS